MVSKMFKLLYISVGSLVTTLCSLFRLILVGGKWVDRCRDIGFNGLWIGFSCSTDDNSIGSYIHFKSNQLWFDGVISEQIVIGYNNR